MLKDAMAALGLEFCSDRVKVLGSSNEELAFVDVTPNKHMRRTTASLEPRTSGIALAQKLD